MNSAPRGRNTDIGLMPKIVDAELGDYFKAREAELRTREFIEWNEAFVVRVDGRAFHTFTRGMHRPYDAMLDLMRKSAATAVLKSLKPDFAYYQSDEISYGWFANEKPEQIHPFHGRVDKLISLCASLTSVAFYREYAQIYDDKDALYGDALPHFDGRLAVVSNDNQEIVRCCAWRENDAMRNSVQMLAQSMFSHKQLQGKNVYDQYLMCVEAGSDWHNVSPNCQRGTYLKTGVADVELTEEQRLKIPEAHRPAAGTKVPRSVMNTLFFKDWNYEERLEALVG